MISVVTANDVEALLQCMEREVDAIRDCFTDDATVADQVGRACKRLMDLAKRYSLEQRIVIDTYLPRRDAAVLEGDFRRGIITPSDYAVQSRILMKRVLELTYEVADAIRKCTSAPKDIYALAQQSARSSVAVSGTVPFFEAAKRRAESRASDQVVFRCENLGKSFARADAFHLHEVNLELSKGQVTGLLGVNGSGKSTLLRIIAGTLKASTGKREYPALCCEPTDWITLRRKIAFVEQRPEKWPGTVIDVLIRQAACFGRTGVAGRENVDFILHRLGLEPHAGKSWFALSGGYRTRVELAKALLSYPTMLILDEPLAPLDIPAQLEFLDDLRSVAHSPESPIPVILSSQHVYEVETVADQMIVLNEGKVSYVGPTKDIGINRPMNAFEITCAHATDSLIRALNSCKVKSIEMLGASSYLITTEINILADDLLTQLRNANISVAYFRDVSQSCRRFLDV
ncbi:MAG TPA: ABC transporter ATP-binding protein [Kiritimatiellia bacterium]|nr:ABC transporter ATP-binding protein [Kiritimatiellia bacterium]HMP33642.1 ABC transporter ATP-binding protein [Kiritimatiellia bacterium]